MIRRGFLIMRLECTQKEDIDLRENDHEALFTQY